jgi:hypothetical protein
MGHYRRMLDQAVGAAEALGQSEHARPFENLLAAGQIGRQFNRDHAAKAVHLAAGERALRMGV